MNRMKIFVRGVPKTPLSKGSFSHFPEKTASVLLCTRKPFCAVFYAVSNDFTILYIRRLLIFPKHQVQDFRIGFTHAVPGEFRHGSNRILHAFHDNSVAGDLNVERAEAFGLADCNLRGFKIPVESCDVCIRRFRQDFQHLFRPAEDKPRPDGRPDALPAAGIRDDDAFDVFDDVSADKNAALFGKASSFSRRSAAA